MSSAAYLRAWRKAHPGYHTQKTRQYRAEKRIPGWKKFKTVQIFGIRVRLA